MSSTLPGLTGNPLQAVLQHSILTRFKTGNELLDLALPYVFLTIMAYLGSQISTIKYYGERLFSKIYHRLLDLYDNHFNKHKKLLFEKSVIIEFLTDDKKINELYKAVFWYITSHLDFFLETPLKYICEKRVELNEIETFWESSINKVVTTYQQKKFNFKNHEILYRLDKDLVTVYGDKERKKENYSITLSCTLNKNDKNDILDEFCRMCVVEYTKNINSQKWTQKIFINHGSKWETRDSKNKRKIDTIILRGDKRQRIVDDVKLFLDSEQWYEDRSIPYQRGFLFYGKPGTGKTSMINGIANLCKRHIHYLILNEINSDSDLMELLRQIKYEETLLVIEDIDCACDMVKQRDTGNNSYKNENGDEKQDTQKTMHDSVLKIEINTGKTEEKKQNGSKLTLSGILNALDGVTNNPGES